MGAEVESVARFKADLSMVWVRLLCKLLGA